MKKFLAVIVSLAMAVCLLGGCSGTSSNEQTLGNKDTGTYNLLIKNGLGFDITEFYMKASNAEDFGDNMLAEGETIAKGASVRLYWSPDEFMAKVTETKNADGDSGDSSSSDASSSASSSSSEASSSASSSSSQQVASETTEVQAELLYDILVADDDEGVALYDSLSLEELKEFTMKQTEDEIDYIEYVKTDGQAGSTEEEAKAAAAEFEEEYGELTDDDEEDAEEAEEVDVEETEDGDIVELTEDTEETPAKS